MNSFVDLPGGDPFGGQICSHVSPNRSSPGQPQGDKYMEQLEADRLPPLAASAKQVDDGVEKPDFAAVICRATGAHCVPVVASKRV
jgi:hypothetical protein